MKIGVNLLFLIPGEVGGSEIYARGLLAALQEHPSKPELILFTNRENHETFAGFTRVAIPVRASNRLRRIAAEQSRLPFAVKREKIDVLLSLGYTSPLRVDVPKVTAVLDMQYRSVPEGFDAASRAAHHTFVGKATRRSDAILTLSEFSQSEIEKYLGIARERIVIAPPGVSPLATPPNDRIIDESFILTVSNTYPHKNVEALVRAMDELPSDIAHRLVVVGQPREGEPPPHDRVIRKHRVSVEELAGLYRDAEVLVAPSLYEGFGLPLLEAMAAGCRVVTAREGAAPEVVGDGGSYIEDTRDPKSIVQAITTAIRESPEERKAFIDKGFARADTYDWATTAEATLHGINIAMSSA